MVKRKQTSDEACEPVKHLQLIQELRLLDDAFMRMVLMRNRAAVRDILRVITKRDDLKICSVRTQQTYSNLLKHGVQLDVLAKDAQGRYYNIEIQRDNSGASPRRARYNFAAIDWNNFKGGIDYRLLPETWVIFITEHRVFGKGEPVVFARRRFDDGTLLDDGQVVCYVDASYDGDDDLGRLMHDFRESDPDKMNFKSLAQRARWIKKEERKKRTDQNE